MNGQRRLRAAALAAFAALVAQGCATAARGRAVPEHLETKAVVSGFPDGIRYFPSNANDLALLEKDWVESVERDRAHRRAQGLTGPRPPGAYLAISGGGDNGAFGAGLLAGWSKAGKRPEFKLVTGVSTGALIAPFAFLGPAYDAQLEAFHNDEMHVDGGTTSQVFVYPAGLRLAELSEQFGIRRKRAVYVIRNARLDPEWAEVDRRTLPIAMRAIMCLIQYQGIGDLYRIFSITQRDGVDFNLAYIPAEFRVPHTAEFDPSYMKQLFQFAYGMAEAGYPWAKRPPVLVSGEEDLENRPSEPEP